MGRGHRFIAVALACVLSLGAAAVHLKTTAQPVVAAGIPFGVGAALQATSFGDANHGWAVGSRLSVTGGLIAATANGGVTWTQQSFPMSTVDQFNGVAAAGPTTAWAVGHVSSPLTSGLVMVTTDGAHWSQQSIPAVDNLTGVSFVSATTGWAVGYVMVGGFNTGAVLATVNGGTTWTSQSVPAGVDMLTSVSFVDANHGWAAGSATSGLNRQSAIIVTSDGGAHWTQQTVPAGSHLNAIVFRDTSHGWAAGLGSTGGQVIATSNGGITWTPETLPSGIPNVAVMAFASLTVGWIVGTNFGGPGIPGSFIAVTGDGGTTWTLQAAPPTNTILYAVAATSPNMAWAVGAGSCLDPSIVATANGGVLWTEELDAVPVLQQLRAVTSVDTTHAWAVGTDSCQSGAIVRTTDGVTWTAGQVPAGVGDLMAVSFADRNHGWAVGFNQGGGPAAAAIAVMTTDGGATWNISQTPAGVGSLLGVHFVSTTKGWAVGTSTSNQGVILTTSDGGMTWTSQSPPAGVNSLNGVHFVDFLHGWAAAASGAGPGQVIVTSDGGANWTAQTTPTGSSPAGIDFTDSLNGWAAGQDTSMFSGGGQVLTTANGGGLWTASAVTAADYLQSVSFADATTGWVAGVNRNSGGVIAASTTAGATWVPQTVPAGISELDGVSAASPTNAWAVGLAQGQGPYGINAAVILGTSNAGVTWGAEAYTYPGMPRQGILPALSNAAYGGYTTAAYIQNLGAAPASVQVNYLDGGGNPVGSGDSSIIQPNGTWTVRQDSGRSFAAGQAGSGVILGSQPLAAFVNEFAPGGGDATSYTGISSGVGSTLYAPAIANAAYGGYTTGIGLLNEGSSPTDVTITYRDGSGVVVKTQTVTGLAAQAYHALYSGDATLALPSGFAGTATITSSTDQPLGAVVNETGPGGQFSSYDAVPSGSTTLNAPVALNNAFGGYYTGMGIQNTSGTAGTVTITYYDSSGTPTTTAHPIAANGSLGVYQGTDIPSGGAYTATITSTVAIATIVNEVAPSSTSAKQSTSYNAFSGGSSSLHLPLVENAGSDPWSTGEGIMNTGMASTTVTVTYYDTATGAPVGTTQSQTLAPHAFWGLYQPTGGLPSGTRAAAVITTLSGGQVAVICNESSATTFMSYAGE